MKTESPVPGTGTPDGDYRNLLLEIGTEEIPARFLPGARAALARILKELLRDNYIDYDRGEKATSVYATPRRLAIIMQVAATQSDRTKEAFGPPKKVAYNDDGTLTKAGEGFARSQGIRPEDLVVRKKGKGEYVAAVIEEKGGPTEELLPDMLKKLILSIPFPKSMRWGEGSITFARPIHWVVALFGDKTVEFELDGIKSGNMSRGHRFLAPQEFVLDEPARYLELLRERMVIADQAERVRIIREEAERLCGAASGKPYYVSHDHPSIVSDLVEYPHAVLGSFDEKYLELPDELLSTVMWGHQKYFSVVNNYKDNELRNHFVIVSNTRAENDATVRRGAERVITARFEDARFYYEEDRKTPLAERLGQLANVTFQDKLGSLYDKTMRIKALAAKLAGTICPEKKALVERAALLSKADLVSGVVYEFPELQGIMGRYYALDDGEEPEVADAIMEHYLPAFAGDRVPAGDVAAAVGLADRMDNIAAFFSAGLKPTGSEDPFALRRQALAVAAILAEKGYGLSIKQALWDALSGLSGISGLAGPEAVEHEVLAFFEQRLEGMLAARDYSHDLVDSVIAYSTVEPLGNLVGRLDALKAFKGSPAYNDFLTAIIRVKNIIPGEELPGVRPGLFRAGEEKALHEALESLRPAVALAAEARYPEALDRLVSLTGPVNAFFERVLVMDKDEAVRQNRLALLKEIWSLVSAVADFSKLSETA